VKEILELTLTLGLTSLAVTTYTLVRLSRLIGEVKIQIAQSTHPTPISHVEDPELPPPSYDSDFDDRIREMTEELEKIKPVGTVYDLPHSAVKTPSKFSPEYAE
jgi:hypothetical protein